MTREDLTGLSVPGDAGAMVVNGVPAEAGGVLELMASYRGRMMALTFAAGATVDEVLARLRPLVEDIDSAEDLLSLDGEVL